MQGNPNVKLLVRLVCLAVLPCIARTAAAQQQAESQLLKILEARAESSGAFTARLKLTALPGKDREIVARYYDWLARNIEKSHPDLNPQNSRLTAEILRKPFEQVGDLFVVYSDPAVPAMRIDFHWLGGWGEPPSADMFGQPPRYINTFSQGEWSSVAPADPGLKSRDRGRMQVTTEAPNAPAFEAARGAGIGYVPAAFDKLNLPKRCRATGMVYWSDLLPAMDRQSARDGAAPPPGLDQPRPMVEISSPRAEPQALPACRVRIWFEPALDYAILAVQTDSLFWNAALNRHEHIRADTLSMSNPGRIGDRDLFLTCRWVRHGIYYTLPDGKVPEEADQIPQTPQSSETEVALFEFSNVQTPVELALATFEPPAGPGTVVYDYAAGVRYIVGNAGEQLERTALDVALRRGATDAAPVDARPLVIAFTLGAIAAVLIVFFMRRRRA